MLDLDDPRWCSYQTRTGVGADIVSLLECPTSDQYYCLYQECCDLGTFDIYPAAYAVLPHLEQLADDAKEIEDMKWPLYLSAAICVCFKFSQQESDVPKELWDDFYTSTLLARETAMELYKRLGNDDPTQRKTLMILPLLDIESKSLFGKPVPNSFVFFDWFEERRPDLG